jgi:hypothetical protein
MRMVLRQSFKQKRRNTPHVASLQAFVFWFPFCFVRAVLDENAIVVHRGARFACQGCSSPLLAKDIRKIV